VAEENNKKIMAATIS